MLKIGHRGAAGYELENSMRSFRKAIELDVDYIECDVQLTQNEVPVIFHDRLLSRLSNGKGYIWDYTAQELAHKVHLRNSESIPHLDTLLQLAKAHYTRLYIEISTLNAETIILPAVLQYFNPDQFLLASFHHQTIRNAKIQYPGIKTVAILEGCPVSMEAIIQNSQCDFVAFGFHSIDPEAVRRVQELERQVLVWTVNETCEIQRAKSIGVDGIISDYPDRI